MICEWCSSPFPQNSFSLISFIIPSYSLFHPPFLPISTPSPSSPLIPAFQFNSHACSFSIHMHPFPSLSSSQPLQSHSLLSIPISILSFHSIASFPFICYSFFDSSFSHVQWYPRPSLSSLHSVFTHSYAFHRFLSFFILIQCRWSHSSHFFSSHPDHFTVPPFILY